MLAKLDELRPRIKDLAVWAKKVGDNIHSPFMREVKEEPLLARFKMPLILSYKGMTDPRDHMDVFNNQIDLPQVNNLAKCHCFAVTLNEFV